MISRTAPQPALRVKPLTIMLSLAVAGLAALSVYTSLFPLDDAYITLHNARTLLAGGTDPVYGGSAVDGATSLVHLALVAAAGALMPLAVAARLVGVVAIILYGLALVRIGRSSPAPLMVVLCGLGGALIPFSLTNGLETGLAMAGLAWAIVLMDDRRLCLMAGLLPFIRPELGLMALLLMGRQAWLLIAAGDRAEAARRLAMAALIALPWLGWTWAATGALLPATGATKIAWYGEMGQPLAKRVYVASVALIISLMPLLLVGLFGLKRRPGGMALIAFSVLWLASAAVTLPGGLFHNHARYLMPLVPIALYGWIGLATTPSAARLMTAVLALTVLPCVIGINGRLDNWDIAAMTKLGKDQRLPPRNAPVLIHDAGYLAWVRPDLRLTDIVGLKTPANGTLHRAMAGQPCGRDLAIGRIAASSGARHLVVLDDRPIWDSIVPAMRVHGWRLTRLNPPRFEGYGLYRLTPPPDRAPIPRCKDNPKK